MIQLAEEINKRGGQPQDPLVYKHQYLALLWESIKDRVAALKAGCVPPKDLMCLARRRCWK
jgi:phosphoglycolate phosphatase